MTWPAVVFLLLAGSGSPVSVVLAQGKGAWGPCETGAIESAMSKYQQLITEEPSWRMEVNMTSFPDPDGAASDHSSSIILCSGKRFKASQMGFITYQNASICAVADPGEHLVVLSNPKLPVDLLVPQRVSTLLAGAERTSCRRDAGGTGFRIMYAEGAGPYQFLDFYYDAVGYLSRIIMQWKPTNYEEGGAPLRVLHSPRIEIEVGRLRGLSKLDSEELAHGLDQRLEMTNGNIKAIGAWNGYRIVDTRYRP